MGSADFGLRWEEQGSVSHDMLLNMNTKFTNIAVQGSRDDVYYLSALGD